jgi:hypothetical protein
MKLLILGMALSGCCSDAFCRDHVEVLVRSTSGPPQPGHWTFTLGDGSRSWTIDCEMAGRATCGDTGPHPANQGAPMVFVFADHWSVEVASAPAQLDVSVARDGANLATGSFHPSYAVHEPNGHICGPTCRTASVELEVP